MKSLYVLCDTVLEMLSARDPAFNPQKLYRHLGSYICDQGGNQMDFCFGTQFVDIFSSDHRIITLWSGPIK